VPPPGSPENGIPTHRIIASWLSSQKNFIMRLPDAKRVFTKPIYKPGDLFHKHAHKQGAYHGGNRQTRVTEHSDR